MDIQLQQLFLLVKKLLTLLILLYQQTLQTATKFTFPSPVFLQNGIEYAFCVITNNDDYTMYTARLGQTTLDGSRLISKQPYLGSMFKSQNASTWTAEQNEDVKFKINRCKFTENTEGTVSC